MSCSPLSAPKNILPDPGIGAAPAAPLGLPAAPAAAPLGRSAPDVSGLRPEEARKAAVAHRYALQRAAQFCLPDHRVADCMRAQVGGLVEVIHHPEYGTASYGGLATCGNPWVCPVCSAKIFARRGQEIAEGAQIWQDRGGTLLLLTLTVQHRAGIPLSDLLNGINEAYRLLGQGRAWQTFKARVGLAGSICRREITHGDNGWHPHLHALYFIKGQVSREEIDQLAGRLAERWQKMVRQVGLTCSVANGLDLRRAGDGAADYISKLGGMWSVAKEMSDGGTKTGLRGNETIAQILVRTTNGESDAVYLFKEYAKSTYRKAPLVWSPGLRKLLFDKEEAKTDEELATEQEQTLGIGLVALGREQWREICRQELRGQLLAAAVAGDAGELALWLARHGVVLEAWQIGYTVRGEKIHGRRE